jgi:hypothetical protein
MEYNPINLGHIQHVYHDGGRRDAGYKGNTGDCVVRAIAIATGISYQEIYDELFKRTEFYRRNRRDKIAKYLKLAGRSKLSPRTGVYREVYEPYLKSLGWEWVAVTGIGTGCKMHLHQNEIPDGVIIFRVSKHLTCTKDKVLYDTYDCTRDGKRMVYGYYRKVEI